MEILFFNDKIKRKVCELLECDDINYQGLMFKGVDIIGSIIEITFGVNLGFTIQKLANETYHKTVSYKDLYELGTSGF